MSIYNLKKKQSQLAYSNPDLSPQKSSLQANQISNTIVNWTLTSRTFPKLKRWMGGSLYVYIAWYCSFFNVHFHIPNSPRVNFTWNSFHVNFTWILFHVSFTLNFHVNFSWNSFHVKFMWNISSKLQVKRHSHEIHVKYAPIFTWILRVEIYLKVLISGKKNLKWKKIVHSRTTRNKIHSLYFTRQMSLVYYRWLCKRFKIAAALVIAENKWTCQINNPTCRIGSGLCLNSRINWSWEVQ